MDLIFKEHDLPEANACRLLRRIVQDDALRTIPVVGVPPHPAPLSLPHPWAATPGRAPRSLPASAAREGADVSLAGGMAVPRAQRPRAPLACHPHSGPRSGLWSGLALPSRAPGFGAWVWS